MDGRTGFGGHGRRRRGIGAVAAVLMIALQLSFADAAHATTTVNGSVTFPDVTTVGQTGGTGSITMTNASTGPESVGNVTVTQITLVPSCGTFVAAADCPNPDPGVYQITSATGAAGTACAGRTFTVTTVDAAQGKVQLTPSSPIVLGPPGSATATCRVDFTFNVVKGPTKDAHAGPGVQTAHLASISAQHQNGASGSVRPAQATTVLKANPTLTTSAQPTVPLGQATHDTANLSGGFNPTGTIDFDLFGPNDATCSGPVRSHSTVPVNGNGTYQSASFTPTQPGTYRWKATYSGDANNYAVLTACNDPAEAFTVPGGSGTTTVNRTSVDPGDVVLVGATGVASPNSTYRLRLGTSAATCHTSPLVLGGNVVSDASGNIAPVQRTIPTNSPSGQRWLCWVALTDTNNRTTPASVVIF